MKIQVLSDLHNEFIRGENPHQHFKWKGQIEYNDADLIILAGYIDVGVRGVENHSIVPEQPLTGAI